jgi:hypothetical protein
MTASDATASDATGRRGALAENAAGGEMTKRCSQCQRDLPMTPEYFWRDRSHKDGFRSCCRECIYARGEKAHYTRTGKKQCGMCKRVFPASTMHFNKNRGSRDGLSSRCKVCANDVSRAHYERVIADPVLKNEAQERRYAWRAANKARVRAYYRKYKRSDLGHAASRRYRKRRAFRRVYQRVQVQQFVGESESAS